jgi:ribonuclease PH
MSFGVGTQVSLLMIASCSFGRHRVVFVCDVCSGEESVQEKERNVRRAKGYWLHD